MKNLNLSFIFIILFASDELRADHLIKFDGFKSFFVETAITREEKSAGLMYIETLDDSTGMIFIYDIPTKVDFWMYNTSLSLDIIFIDANKKIISVKSGDPFSTKIISSEKPVIAVLEIPFNCSKKIGLTVGRELEWIPLEKNKNIKKNNICKKL